MSAGPLYEQSHDPAETDPETPADARLPINIHPHTRKRLRDFLMRPDVPRGMGYTAFIEWAIQVGNTALEDCQDDSSGFCAVHYAPGQGEEDGSNFVCDGKGLLSLI